MENIQIIQSLNKLKEAKSLAILTNAKCDRLTQLLAEIDLQSSIVSVMEKRNELTKDLNWILKAIDKGSCCIAEYAGVLTDVCHHFIDDAHTLMKVFNLNDQECLKK